MRHFCQIFDDGRDPNGARGWNSCRGEEYSGGYALVHVHTESARDVDITIEFSDVDTDHIEMLCKLVSCALFLQFSRQLTAVTAPVRFKFDHQESAVRLRLGPCFLNPQQSSRSGPAFGLRSLCTVMRQKDSYSESDKKNEPSRVATAHIF